MSDVPPLCPMHTYLQWKLSVESPSFTYAARSTSKDILFAVDIPFPLLRAWYNLVVLKKPFQTSCTCDPKKISINLPSNFPQFTYIELFEFAIPGNSFGLTPDQVVRSEINNSLRVMAAKVYAESYMSNTSAQYSMDKQNVHWTNCILEYQMDFRRCSLGVLDSLDPMVDSNVQWTFECQMAMLAALSWALVTGDYDTA